MKISQQLFRKGLKKINENDLISFFSDEKAETNNLEYKAHFGNTNIDEVIEKIIKTICAFLNADGGLLIYGAPVGKQPDGYLEKIFVGQLQPCPIKKGQDWFINKISSSISPMPSGIEMQIVSITNGGFVYLFEVNESSYKPHQFEGRYMIRLDGQNKSAPHYLVDALIRQIKYPDLRCALKIIGIKTHLTDRFIIQIDFAIFNFSPSIIENGITYNLLCNGANIHYKVPHNNAQVQVLNDARSGQIIRKKSDTNLYYSSPHYFSEALITLPDINAIHIILTFGGNKSPLRYCEYKIDLSSTFNISNALKTIQENKLVEPRQSIEQTLAWFKKNWKSKRK